MPLERRELLVTVCLELVKPRLDRHNRFRSKPEHPGAGVLGWTFVGDDSCLEQHTQVPAHRRCGCARCRRELTRAPRAVTEELYDLLTGLISQRPKKHGDITRHIRNSYVKAKLLSSAGGA